MSSAAFPSLPPRSPFPLPPAPGRRLAGRGGAGEARSGAGRPEGVHWGGRRGAGCGGSGGSCRRCPARLPGRGPRASSPAPGGSTAAERLPSGGGAVHLAALPGGRGFDLGPREVCRAGVGRGPSGLQPRTPGDLRELRPPAGARARRPLRGGRRARVPGPGTSRLRSRTRPHPPNTLVGHPPVPAGKGNGRLAGSSGPERGRRRREEAGPARGRSGSVPENRGGWTGRARGPGAGRPRSARGNLCALRRKRAQSGWMGGCALGPRWLHSAPCPSAGAGDVA